MQSDNYDSNDSRIGVDRASTLRLQRSILLSEMSLEYSYGHSRESDQKLGYGAASGISRRSTASDAPGGSFRVTIGRIKPKTFYPGPRFIACKGESQSYHCIYN